MIQKDRLLKTFYDLININSPSRNERGVADYLIRELVKLGFEIIEDDAGEKIGGNTGNLIATLKGDESFQPIFFNAHMDTVESTKNINIIVDGDIIKTDGTTILGADDKVGISVIVEGMRSLIESGKKHGDIKLVFDVSEEIGLFGIRNFDYSLLKGYIGFVLDTQTPACALTLTAPSDTTINVQIFGKAAHAGMAPENGISAVCAAANAISKMRLGRIDYETTASIGTIHGGKARNIIPDHVTIQGEARSRNKEKLCLQLEHMETLFVKEAEKIGATAKIEFISEYKAFAWSEDDILVRFAADVLKNCDKEVIYQNGGGGSCANILNANGIPTLLVAVGYENAHTHDEFANINAMISSSEFIECLAESAAKC